MVVLLVALLLFAGLALPQAQAQIPANPEYGLEVASVRAANGELVEVPVYVTGQLARFSARIYPAENVKVTEVLVPSEAEGLWEMSFVKHNGFNYYVSIEGRRIGHTQANKVAVIVLRAFRTRGMEGKISIGNVEGFAPLEIQRTVQITDGGIFPK